MTSCKIESVTSMTDGQVRDGGHGHSALWMCGSSSGKNSDNVLGVGEGFRYSWV